MEKYLVNLTDEERDTLNGLLKKGKAAARRLAHARILLLADEGQDDEAIADIVTVSSRTISRVRKRLVTEGFLDVLVPTPVSSILSDRWGSRRPATERTSAATLAASLPRRYSRGTRPPGRRGRPD